MSEVPDNRKWHMAKSWSPIEVGLLVVAIVGATAGFIYWYGDQQSRLSDEEVTSRVLLETVKENRAESEKADDELKRQLNDMNERWRAALREQERRTERKYDELNKQLESVRALLEQIALNTKSLQET